MSPQAAHSATFPCQEKTETLCYQTAVTHISPAACCCQEISDGDNRGKCSALSRPRPVPYCVQLLVSDLRSCSCLGHRRAGDAGSPPRPGAGQSPQSVADSVQCHWRIRVTQEYSRQPVSVPVLSLQRVHWSPSSCLQSRNLSPLAKTTRFCPPYTAIASSVSPELVSDPSTQLRVSAPPLLPSALRLHPLPASNPRH